MATATQMDAFGATSPAPVQERPFFDAMDAAARTKLDAPPEWEWYSARALPGGDVLLVGGIPNAGPKSKRWRGVKGQEVVVTQEQIRAAKAKYEADTGKCAECAGCGDVLKSVSVHTGRTYRTCSRCAGSGASPRPTTPEGES